MHSLQYQYVYEYSKLHTNATLLFGKNGYIDNYLRFCFLFAVLSHNAHNTELALIALIMAYANVLQSA